MTKPERLANDHSKDEIAVNKTVEINNTPDEKTWQPKARNASASQALTQMEEALGVKVFAHPPANTRLLRRRFSMKSASRPSAATSR